MPDTPEHDLPQPQQPDAEQPEQAAVQNPAAGDDAVDLPQPIDADNADTGASVDAANPIDTMEMQLVVGYNAVEEPTQAVSDTEEMQAVAADFEDDIDDEPALQAAPEPDTPEPQLVLAADATLEEMTLAQLLDHFRRAPVQTWQAFWSIARPDPQAEHEHVSQPVSLTVSAAAPRTEAPQQTWGQRLSNWLQNERLLQLGLYLVAVLVAWFGNSLFVSNTARRTEQVELASGAPFLLIGFLIWMAAELIGNWRGLLSWWRGQKTPNLVNMLLRALPLGLIIAGIGFLIDSTDDPIETVFAKVAPGAQFLLAGVLIWMLIDALTAILRLIAHKRPGLLPGWVPIADPKRKDAQTQTRTADDYQLPWTMRIHPLRIFFVLAAFFLIVLTWFGTVNNTITTPAFYAWLGTITLVSLALAPLDFNALTWLRKQWERLRLLDLRPHLGVLLLLGVILLVALGFRITDINNLPPEMTSDHVEKALDAQRVTDGARNIFFANNGGREPFQMYAIAVVGQLTGMGVTFSTLKLVAVLEAMLTIPVLFWLGVEIMGERNRRFGVLLGLVLAALVAASYWHTSITRLSLRIIVTPLVASLLLIFLARGLRRNTRADFIIAGLILGFGLYTYQAVRMLPVLIVVAVGMAVYFHARTWGERWRLTINLSTLVLVSFVVFVPMFHYSVENPEEFWRRTTGRLLGDNVIQETLSDGTIIQRDATVAERIEAFNQNVPTLMNNLRNAFLMFNWKGDVAWINGAPNHPALSPIAGAFLVVGVAAWLSWLVRRRDIVHWVIPVTVFIMLLPSALSIAFPLENPSHTRTSGALPAVYLIAALPLSLILWRVLQWLPGRRGQIAALVLGAGVITASYLPNSSVYFDDFRESYLSSSLPYSDAGRILQGFALSDGAFGNAYMIAYPFWWDHRAVGMAAGVNDWPNGIVSLNDVPEFLDLASERTGRYTLNPSRDLLFFYHVDDDETAAQLAEWFPQGRELRINSYQQGDDFMTYRVPALSRDDLELFFLQHG